MNRSWPTGPGSLALIGIHGIGHGQSAPLILSGESIRILAVMPRNERPAIDAPLLIGLHPGKALFFDPQGTPIGPAL